jgi:AcrR family transcriptional regulator
MSKKSRKLPRKSQPRKDGRVRRTRDVLGDALVKLMHEKPFEEIKVQEVLEHAGVGRSTFYTHFRDKEDLFLSDVEDFFEMMSTQLERNREVSNRVAPVRELFAHVAEWRPFFTAMVAAGKIHDAMELGQGIFARAIERRLAGQRQARAIPAEERAALAQGLAGALLAQLTWWINSGSPESAEQMDENFHRMVWYGVSPPAGRTPSAAS